MGGPSPNSRRFTVQCSLPEYEALKRAAAEAGISINGFVGLWLAELIDKQRKSP